MAAPQTFRFGAGTLWISDMDEETPVFTKICGFNQIDMKFERNTNDTTVPDCDDPDAAAWTERDVISRAFTASFSGVLAKSALPLIEAAFASDASVDCRINLTGAGTGVGTPDRRYAGKMHVKYSIKGQRGDKYELTVELENDGAVAATNVAAPT